MRPPAETCRIALEALRAHDPRILERYVEIVHPPGVSHFRVHGTPAFRLLAGTWRTSGKGHSPEQALASGLMELVERYSCYTYLRDAPGADHGPRDALDSSAMSFDDFMSCFYHLPDDRTLSARELESTPLTWFAGRTLDDRPIAIPARLICYVLEGTNGMACGNSFEEALLHGLLEVLERHCLTHVRLGRRHTPHLDLESVDSPLVSELLERLAATGEAVLLRDFSLGIGVPVVAAVRRLGDGKTQVTVGSATTREEAALRAITENVQTQGLMNCYPAGDSAHYLDVSGAPLPFDSVRNIDHANILSELDAVAGLLVKCGMHAAYLDTTQASLGLPAVMCFVFGAQFHSDDLAHRSLLLGYLHDARLGGHQTLAGTLARLCLARDPANRTFAEMSLALDETARGEPLKARRRLESMALGPNGLTATGRQGLSVVRESALAHIAMALGDLQSARRACAALVVADPTVTAEYVKVAAPPGVDAQAAGATADLYREIREFWLFDGRPAVERTLTDFASFATVRGALEERLRAGEDLFDRGQYEDALAEARAALAMHTAGAELLGARWLSGRCLARLERWSEAAAELTTIHGLQYDQPKVILLRDLCRRRAGGDRLAD